MSVKPADTGNLKNHTHKLNELTMYPHKALILDISGYTGSVLNIDPLPNRNGIDDYVVWVNGVTWENNYDSSSPDTIDLTNTGLGGLVDGITFTAANARDFLIWGLANNANNGFDGFAVTHKPYSAYTGPAAIGLGATALNITGLTNAYQFTPGARIVIRNTVGTSPQFQWNWGTINSIVSSTSINVTMDNLTASYGIALTAATGGEIQQWNKFRPWVVTSSSQTLYSNNYRLVGELYTDSSGYITDSHHVNDEWRGITNIQVYSDTNTTIAGGFIVSSIARSIPLWAKTVHGLVIARNTSPIQRIYLMNHKSRNLYSGIQNPIEQANVYQRRFAEVPLDSYARLSFGLDVTTTTNHTFTAWIYGYRVPGGMKE